MNTDFGMFPARDNHALSAKGETRKYLEAVLSLSPIETVESYSKNCNGLSFMWMFRGQEHETRMPVETNAKDLAPTILSWIEKEAEFTPKPDIDGDCYKGWKITIDKMCNSIIVEPRWMYCHK